MSATHNKKKDKQKSAEANKSKVIGKKGKPLAMDAIGSEERMAALIAEAEAELAAIEPKIEKLEVQLSQLADLKIQRQKLLTFKMSLQAINKSYASLDNDVSASLSSFEASNSQNASKSNSYVTSASLSHSVPMTRQFERGEFDASEALRQAKRLVRVSSLNFQLFQALVANGGIADTPAVKHYLLSQDVRQPGSGDGFEEVALTSISSRINYLVRKGLVEADGRGAFVSRFGWSNPVVER